MDIAGQESIVVLPIKKTDIGENKIVVYIIKVMNWYTTAKGETVIQKLVMEMTSATQIQVISKTNLYYPITFQIARQTADYQDLEVHLPKVSSLHLPWIFFPKQPTSLVIRSIYRSKFIFKAINIYGRGKVKLDTITPSPQHLIEYTPDVPHCSQHFISVCGADFKMR